MHRRYEGSAGCLTLIVTAVAFLVFLAAMGFAFGYGLKAAGL